MKSGLFNKLELECRIKRVTKFSEAGVGVEIADSAALLF